jgi:hypothetical protein
MRTNKYPFTVRLTKAQCAIVTDFAVSHDISEYRARLLFVERGLAATCANESQSEASLLDLQADILARLEALERLADRTLFTAASAYTFAHYAAHRGANNSEALNASLSEASLEAYRRQLEIARGGS